MAAVRALDRATGQMVTLGPADCGFGYRDSRFRSGEPERHVILAVTYRLVPGGPPAVRYAELRRHLEARGVAAPTLADGRGPASWRSAGPSRWCSRRVTRTGGAAARSS